MGWNVNFRGARNNLIKPSTGAGVVSGVAPTVTDGEAGALTQEQDWVNRSTAAGVVWAHDFRTDAEVNAFRWTSSHGSGNDPNAVGHATATDCHRLSTDGPTGNCLEIIRRAGTQECESVWWRPFVPCSSPGNGLGANDLADGGAISVHTYTPTNGGDEIASITRGYYGHASYQDSNFDGGEFWLQFRVKMDPRRLLSSDDVGKLSYLTTAYRSLTSQELVTYSKGTGGNQGTHKNYFRLYGVWQVFAPLEQEINISEPIQPGSDVSEDWFYSDGWDTIMYHIVPGRVGVDETLIEIFAAHPWESTFTKIWSQTVPVVEYEWDNGWNALILATYNNDNDMNEDFYHRYTQVIFSKQVIACPMAVTSAPSWFTSASDRHWLTPVGNTLDAVKPSPVPAGVGHRMICDAWTGGCVDQVNGEYILAANGGHGDYGGNEVYGVMLRAASPVWVRLNNPSTISGGTDALNSDMNYGDGLPRPPHGYNRCVFGNGKVWYAGMDSTYPSGYYSKACYEFDRASLTWTFHGRPATGDAVWEGGPAAYDRVGNRVWSAAGYANDSGGYSVDASNGDITTYNWTLGGNPFSQAWSVVVWDRSPRCWIVGSVNDAEIWILNLENVAAGWTQKTPTGSPTGFIENSGAVFHAPSNAILVYDHTYGTSIRKLSVPDNPVTGNYSWSTITALGGATPPGSVSGDFNGVYSKFNLIEDMGNGQSALVVVCSTTGSTYVYKLPRGGV